ASRHDDCKTAIDLFRRRGYQSVAVSENNGDADLDLSMAPISPLEWAALPRLFDACVSERMHGCIFALLNGTPLISIDRRRPTMGFKTKNNELMTRLNLDDFYVPTGEARSAGTKDDLTRACERLLSDSWPRDVVHARLMEFRQIGQSFLERHLPAKVAA